MILPRFSATLQKKKILFKPSSEMNFRGSFIILEPVTKISRGSQDHLSNDFSVMGEITPFSLQIIHQQSEAPSKRELESPGQKCQRLLIWHRGDDPGDNGSNSPIFPPKRESNGFLIIQFTK